MEAWHFGIRDLIDIGLVAVVIYFVLSLIRGTRAVQMLIGIAVVVVVYELARSFGLLTVEWLFGHFFSAFIVILVVLFQHEIRRGLMQMGKNPLATNMDRGGESTNEGVVDASFALVHRGWGGLIVIERDTGLRHLYDSGVEINAALRPDVVISLFCPQAPLHDGAIIVRDGCIVAARVLLPLTQTNISSGGTRHRAAMGLSEESDALIVVVSEEQRSVRIAEGGRLSNALDAAELRTSLHDRLVSQSGMTPSGIA
ncbi:MAG: diadenylate cyclase CdaA [Mariprofundaceae bacterium]